MANTIMTLSPNEYRDLEFEGLAGPSWRMISCAHEDLLAGDEPRWDRRYAALSRKGRGGIVHVVPVEIVVPNRPFQG